MIVSIVAAAFALAASLHSTGSTATAHPLHTTLTEVTVDREHHVVRAVVRVFKEDLDRAVAQSSRRLPAASEEQLSAYVSGALRLSSAGAPLALHSCGIRTSGDLLWVCVEGTGLTSTASLELRNALLCELFSDQVNIVQIDANGAKKSVLFTRGDGPKRLV